MLEFDTDDHFRAAPLLAYSAQRKKGIRWFEDVANWLDKRQEQEKANAIPES